jgi:hypothetical protein
MPTTLNTDFDADRFAALVGRFDTTNPSEAEAMNAARALRRMVAERHMRVVDVLGRDDVTKALDAHLKPVREDSPELKAAFLEVAKYAELAREQAEMVEKLRRQAIRARVVMPTGLISGRLVAFTVLLALGLMLATLWH